MRSPSGEVMLRVNGSSLPAAINRVRLRSFGRRSMADASASITQSSGSVRHRRCAVSSSMKAATATCPTARNSSSGRG